MPVLRRFVGNLVLWWLLIMVVIYTLLDDENFLVVLVLGLLLACSCFFSTSYGAVLDHLFVGFYFVYSCSFQQMVRSSPGGTAADSGDGPRNSAALRRIRRPFGRAQRTNSLDLPVGGICGYARYLR